MKYLLILCFVALILFLLSACETGYTKKNGNWVWTTHDEHFGKRHHWIDGIDNKTFKVVKENKNFAVDKNWAYFRGRKINNARSDGFQVLTKDAYGYAKNKEYVFFDNEVIIGADPATFQVIQFPYSSDKSDVYCGTIPLKLAKEELEEFKVSNENKHMYGMKSVTILHHFLELHPEFTWITDQNIEIKHVITGEWGTGETSKRKFEGFTEIEF